jgi:hypothetical protein
MRINSLDAGEVPQPAIAAHIHPQCRAVLILGYCSRCLGLLLSVERQFVAAGQGFVVIHMELWYQKIRRFTRSCFDIFRKRTYY